MEKNKTYLLDECKRRLMAIRDTLDLIGGKWKISIIACLNTRSMRFGELVCEIKGISSKVLSEELKTLEMNHIISKKLINPRSKSVKYYITEHGRMLEPLTKSIANWGALHRSKVIGK